MAPQDCVFVENRDGEIVSSLCLIPWKWNCDGALLEVGEMGIVGTAEKYRKRGLIRAQVGYFKQRLQERGCVVSAIQGIPGFYRQFGYEYALPLEGGYRLELRHVPTPQTPEHSVRAAAVGDIPALMSMYDEAVAPLSMHTERSELIWRYLMTRNDPADAMYRETWIIEGADGAAEGYCRIPRHHFGTELVLDEASASRYATTLAILDHAKTLAQKRNQPGIRLNLPSSSPLVRIALSHGATNLGTYAWQIRVPDSARLLRALRPALQTRLDGSMFCAWTGVVCVSFYTHGVALTFERGRLRSVEACLPPADAQIRMPFAAFVPLAMGYRSADELRDQFPDVSVHGMWKLMLETLFPKRESFLYPAY